MKKTTLLFILFLTGLMACSTPVTPEDKPKQQNNAAPAFQLFPTTNMWTFIKRSHVASTIRHSRRQPNGSRAKRKLPCRKRKCRERAIHPLFHKKHVHIHSPRPARWQNVANTMGYRCQPTACYSYKSDSKFY
mgnify:CR=1 FL=1